jgi:hypothetical protein
MNLQLENKLALVTGSTAGIGFAIAKALPPKERLKQGQLDEVLAAPSPIKSPRLPPMLMRR